MTQRSAARADTTVRASRRVLISFAVGVIAAVICGLVWDWPYSPLVGWDAAAIVFSGGVWLAVLARFGPTETAAHATREDPSTRVTELIILTASVASLVAVGYVLIKATSAHGSAEAALAGLGVASIALSWFAVHTLFTLRYAKLYYGTGGGGIDFNQKTPPRYVDFAYLAFTIGMTFQTSDTDIETSAIRATALRHALLSYLFGAVILGATINLIVSLGGSH